MLPFDSLVNTRPHADDSGIQMRWSDVFYDIWDLQRSAAQHRLSESSPTPPPHPPLHSWRPHMFSRTQSQRRSWFCQQKKKKKTLFMSIKKIYTAANGTWQLFKWKSMEWEGLWGRRCVSSEDWHNERESALLFTCQRSLSKHVLAQNNKALPIWNWQLLSQIDSHIKDSLHPRHQWEFYCLWCFWCSWSAPSH